MRPLRFFAATLLFAVPAGAVECKPWAFGPAQLLSVCGGEKTLADCQHYQKSFVQACLALKDPAEDEVARLKAIPSPTPADRAALARNEKIIAEVKSAYASAVSASEAARKLPPGPSPLQRFGEMERSIIQNLSLLDGLLVNAPPVPLEPEDTSDEDAKSKEQRAAEQARLTKTAAAVEREAVKDPKGDPRGLALAGRLFADAGRPDDAARAAKELIAAAPADPSGPNLAARAALIDGHPELAAEWARKALALDPSNKVAVQILGLAQSILSKSRLKGSAAGPAFEEGPAEEAGPATGSAKAGGPARPAAPPPSPALPFVTPEAAPLTAPPHLSLARRKAAVGDLAGALADLTFALDQNPDDDAARLLRAEISLELKNPDAALADAEKILARRPEDPRALRAKASALLQLGRLDEALAVIDRALALDPLSGAAHLTRAMILEKLGRALDAAAAFREAARLEPSLTPVADQAMRRLGFAPSAPADGPVPRRLLRGGLIVVSLALVLAGLIGGAAKLRTMRAAAAVPAREEARVLDVGSLVGGQYTIKRVLGRGGMGVVFEALDETLKRSVALKQLQADLMTDEDAARFLQEARLVAQLKHPNIAEIHAAVDDGGLFLVFELVDGQPLDQVLAQGGALAPDEVRRVIGDLCAGLGCAHGRRIIHRDLKPSNVMLAQDGRSKIMDFGIAHQARGAAATQTAMSGTPPYMAPEQAMGTVLPSSDLYALGVMTYELLSGTRPFLGPDFLGPKMRGEFNPVTRLRPGLPPSLDAFFSAALSPDPARRPGDAASFHKAFDACWS